MQVWPLPRRQKHLLELVNGTSGATPEAHFPVWYEGVPKNFHVYTVPLDLPVYRLANGRTRAAQAERIATEGLADNFFDDPDSVQALEVQNDILGRMVHEKNLLNYFKKNDQAEPLLLTPRGYVVNGNRRLCAMRKLVAEDETRHRHFKQVKVVILPTDEEEPIRRLEAKLQVEPDVRADYSWVALAMMRRGLRTIGMTDEQIAELHNTKPAEIRKSIDMLDHAEAYLTWSKLPGKYSAVEKKMYAFDQLKRNRENPGQPAPRVELATNISYLLIDDPKNGRLYERIPDLFKNLDEVKQRIRDRFPDLPDPTQTTETAASADLFGGEAGQENEYAELIATADRHRDDVRTLVQEALLDIDDRLKQKKDAETCLSLITRAHSYLLTAANSFDGNAVLDGIPKQLDGIEAAVQRIRKWLADHDHA